MARIKDDTKERRKERIWLLVRQHNGVRQSELAELSGFQNRTVYNYLSELEREGKVYKDGVLWFDTGYQGAQLRRFEMSAEEAFTLYLAARLFVKQTDRRNEYAETALSRLAEVLQSDVPISPDIQAATQKLSERKDQGGYQDIYQTVTRAYLQRRKLQLSYKPAWGKSFETTFSVYLIEPSAIGMSTYIIGHSSIVDDLRSFKLNRIESAEIIPKETYAIPEEFPGLSIFDTAWSIITGEETARILLRFSPAVSDRVLETNWHPSQDFAWDEDKPGYLRWWVDVADTTDMLPWIRSWGSDLEVLEPKALRRSIERHVMRLNEIYGLSTAKETPAIAHTLNGDGERHPLVTHLQAVADMACQFASPLQASELAHYLGLWHDLGKFHPDFQQYLLDAEARIRRRGPDHKAAGVRVALEQKVDPIALLLQGHHGGLKEKTDLQRWYEQCKDETEKALQLARDQITFTPSKPIPLPSFIQSTPHSPEFFLRMLFSTLVDADFLDTEAHFNPDKSVHRGSTIDIATLWRRFDADQKHRFAGVPETTVNRSRQEIYDACIAAAAQSPGLFRLTVPTGGGKTRSGMAFALRHALEHKQRRIIVAVPYITITQQTAGVYRSIFNNSEDDEPAVLEHHSGVTEQSDTADQYDPQAIWQRLAAENWDAPIIVTTTVQLFESLFANSTSRCRKLHRLANSVIILDEAQSLPAHLLDPMLDGLRELCANYGSTVVLSTATQPAFDTFEPFKVLNTREIVPAPERHFQTLKRVDYEWRVDQTLSWPEVAELMRGETQALAICNTKQDALNLLDALDDPDALHLSTLLCGAHRTAVITEVKRRLDAGEPCRLVATQVVEAGVDIDFPLVLRALGPLDSIIQAAGRANREGKLDSGRVIIFKPADGGMPPGAYQRAARTTITLLNSGPLDMHDPMTMQQYFRNLYQLEDAPNSEGKIIQKLRCRLNYPEVARRFRLIENDTIGVIVTTYGSAEERQRVRNILERLRHGAPPTRGLMRQLQPYTISLWQHQANKYLNQGFLSPQDNDGIPPGIWEWTGQYDKVRGLSADINIDQLIF